MNCTERWNVQARGFVTGIDPLKYNFPILMLQLISVFAISRALHFILRPLVQPTLICNMLAGIILGPSLIGRNKKFRETFFPAREMAITHIIAAIGILYFIFLVAVKVDLRIILKTSRKKVWTTSISSIVLPFATNLCLYLVLVRLLNKHILKQYGSELFNVTMILSLTAFPSVVHLLDEINLLTSELGNLAMSCAVVNDCIRMLIVIVVVTTRNIAIVGWYWSVVTVVALIGSAFVLRPIPIWIIKATPEGKPVKEIYIIALLVGALIMGGLSHVLFGTVAIGAAIFGIIIPTGPPLGSIIVQKTEALAMELLLPILYVILGLNIDVFSIRNWELFAVYQMFFVAVSLGKLAGTLIPASLVYKMSFRNSLTLGLMMDIKGVFELMQLIHARKRGMIQQTCTALLLSTTASTAIIAPLIAFLHKPRERLHASSNRHLVRTIQAANKSVGELRVLLCLHEEDTVGSIISLLEASNPTSVHPIYACVVHLLELVGRDAPIIIPYHKRGLAWKSSKSDHIMRAFSKYSKYTNSKITISPFTLFAPVKSMHECIHRLAQDQSTPLIIVPINKFRRDVHHHDHHANPLKNVGVSVQENAPCTVGILVNMCFNDPMRYTRFSYHVAVIFIGGADDREALAYGIRMSGHPSVSITVLRIIFGEGDKKVDKVERRTDDYLIDEYKEMNAGNACAVYCEELVDDIVQAISLLKSLKSDYDLVMVGRRRCSNKFIDEEMGSWSENPELGVIGDVLVTSDSIGIMPSVLVMQHCDEVDA